MIERNVTQRAASRLGVAAVSESDGMTKRGGGPGFGPTLNVNAPRTGCPSTEMTRQKTRYQPSGTRFSGTTSSSGLVAERRTAPSTCWSAAAFVTETIAKRGSTASL